MLTGPVPHGRPSPHDNGQPYAAHKSITGQDQLNSSRVAAARGEAAVRILGLTQPVPILVREDTLLWLVDVELVFANPAGISYRTIARIERIDGPLGGSRETNEALFQRSNQLGSFLSAGVQLRACEWMRTKAAS